MELINAIRNAARKEVRMILKAERLPADPEASEITARRFMFKADQAMAMVRVEIARGDTEYEIEREWHDARYFDRTSAWGDGPRMVDGVAWYYVDRLPAPGWRVINPMRVPNG